MPRPVAITAPKRRRKCVYVARCLTCGDVKIGFSANVAARVKGLGYEHDHPLSLVACFLGERRTERQWQERFAEFRAHGEWFRGDGIRRWTEFLGAAVGEEMAVAYEVIWGEWS